MTSGAHETLAAKELVSPCLTQGHIEGYYTRDETKVFFYGCSHRCST